MGRSLSGQGVQELSGELLAKLAALVLGDGHVAGELNGAAPDALLGAPVDQQYGKGALAGIGGGIEARGHADAGEYLPIAHVLAARHPDGDPDVGLIEGHAAPALAIERLGDGLLHRLQPGRGAVACCTGSSQGAALLPAYWNCSASA